MVIWRIWLCLIDLFLYLFLRLFFVMDFILHVFLPHIIFYLSHSILKLLPTLILPLKLQPHLTNQFLLLFSQKRCINSVNTISIKSLLNILTPLLLKLPPHTFLPQLSLLYHAEKWRIRLLGFLLYPHIFLLCIINPRFAVGLPLQD